MNMPTKHTEILTLAEIARAAGILADGGLVVFPTETVWGLGADARNREACRGIFEAKGRPQDNPLIVHVANTAVLSTVARTLRSEEEALIAAFMPGPLTLIVPRSPLIPEEISGGRPDVGVRMPREHTAHALLEAFAFPVAAPSANVSGRPSPTTFEMAKAAMWGRVDAILEGPHCDVGLESTVVRVREDELQILRPGAVTTEQLTAIVPKLEPVRCYLEQPTGAPSAPGLKYPHYKPRARVVAVGTLQRLVELSQTAQAQGAYAVLWSAPKCDPSLFAGLPGEPHIYCFESIEEYARQLFSCFHAIDANGAGTILAQLPPDHGLGQALRNRLLKAANEVAL